MHLTELKFDIELLILIIPRRIVKITNTNVYKITIDDLSHVDSIKVILVIVSMLLLF